MGKAKVTINDDEIQAFLDGDHGVDPLLDAAAQRALETARANAPVDTGTYQASLHVETDHTDRTVRRIASDVPYAMVIEARTGNLARSLDAAR